MRNAAIIGRKELVVHERYTIGVTAGSPFYVATDLSGNKEWVVDVYLGDPTSTSKAIARNVPIAPYARELVTNARTPVMLERSRQGKLTVVGRSKVMTAGAQGPDGSILEPTFHEIEYNLADLGLLFVADLDYTLEKWGDKTWGDGSPWQDVSATDAFGAEVFGSILDPLAVPKLFSPAGQVTTTARHVLLTRRTWGNPDTALRWGEDPWAADLQKILEHTA